MTVKEQISIDEFDGKRYQIRLIEPNDNKKSHILIYGTER
jgi:DNA (cytosine-5)-methyltransferase 1